MCSASIISAKRLSYLNNCLVSFIVVMEMIDISVLDGHYYQDQHRVLSYDSFRRKNSRRLTNLLFFVEVTIVAAIIYESLVFKDIMILICVRICLNVAAKSASRIETLGVIYAREYLVCCYLFSALRLLFCVFIFIIKVAEKMRDWNNTTGQNL
ncbi:MAG: hypothetical protein MHMPM18_003184 [Marteilia pararefringens]